MCSHWRGATVGENGKLTLDNLPFEAGEDVEVTVRFKRPAKVS
jgi:hypothetical protein